MITLGKHNKAALLILLSAAMAACGGGPVVSSEDNTMQAEVITDVDVSEAALVVSATKTTGGPIDTDETDYAFPDVVTNAGLTLNIPAGPAPTTAGRRTVASGMGESLSFGDVVTLRYDMFRWSDGTLVDSSEQYDVARTVLAGDSETYPVPDYLAKSLLGRSLGDVIQVVLPAGTQDLPPELDVDDAHVVLVELL